MRVFVRNFSAAAQMPAAMIVLQQLDCRWLFVTEMMMVRTMMVMIWLMMFMIFIVFMTICLIWMSLFDVAWLVLHVVAFGLADALPASVPSS